MTERWTIPNLEQVLSDTDLVALAQDIAYRGGTDGDEESPPEPHTEARCPTCRAWRPIFCLSLWPGPLGDRHFRCDGCLFVLDVMGQDKIAALESLGAPDTLIAATAEMIDAAAADLADSAERRAAEIARIDEQTATD